MKHVDLAVSHAPPATDWKDQLPLYFAGGASAAAVVSIAASQILLGLALASLIATGRKPRWLPIYPALITWCLLTVLSALHSGHALKGFPQIKKFYVYLMLVVVSTAFRKVSEVRVLAFVWSAVAALSAGWSLVQFARKYRGSIGNGADFYTSYVSDRVTGFMDHWMTFSGEMMMALLIVGALLLFSRDRSGLAWLYPAGTLIAIGLVAAFTRSMWVGAAVGGAFLLWCRRPVLILALPLAAGLLILANPFQLRDRVVSIFQPHGDLDSNAHRVLTRRVGWEMIKAHRLLGVGPEQVGPQFESYVPADTPRPLPRGYYGHLHNIYYHYAAERGVPALLALLWLLGRAIFDFARTLRTSQATSETRWVLYAALAVLIAVMLSGYEEVNLGDSEVLAMFLAMVACGYVAVLEQPSSDIDAGLKPHAR
jgi:putative inorganic carbon (HCO3(-)) transporter